MIVIWDTWPKNIIYASIYNGLLDNFWKMFCSNIPKKTLKFSLKRKCRERIWNNNMLLLSTEDTNEPLVSQKHSYNHHSILMRIWNFQNLFDLLKYTHSKKWPLILLSGSRCSRQKSNLKNRDNPEQMRWGHFMSNNPIKNQFGTHLFRCSWNLALGRSFHNFKPLHTNNIKIKRLTDILRSALIFLFQSASRWDCIQSSSNITANGILDS